MTNSVILSFLVRRENFGFQIAKIPHIKVAMEAIRNAA
jgi:hypothetical protein